MAADKTETDIADVERWADDLMKEEPARYPTEEEVEKGKKESEPFDLSRDAKPWEIIEALGNTRSEVGLALQSVASVLEDLLDEIKRLKMHRHDTTKSYSGRPEL